jgi:hypothetical protein
MNAKKTIVIDGQEYERIPYDDLTRNCHDCGVEYGELHKLGCDMERCPKCKQQLISCNCSVSDTNGSTIAQNNTETVSSNDENSLWAGFIKSFRVIDSDADWLHWKRYMTKNSARKAAQDLYKKEFNTDQSYHDWHDACNMERYVPMIKALADKHYESGSTESDREAMLCRLGYFAKLLEIVVKDAGEWQDNGKMFFDKPVKDRLRPFISQWQKQHTKDRIKFGEIYENAVVIWKCCVAKQLTDEQFYDLTMFAFHHLSLEECQDVIRYGSI